MGQKKGQTINFEQLSSERLDSVINKLTKGIDL